MTGVVEPGLGEVGPCAELAPYRSEPLPTQRATVQPVQDDVVTARSESGEVAGEVCEDGVGEGDGAVGPWGLGWPERGLAGFGCDELAVDGEGPAEEVDAVDGEAGGLALAETGAEPERGVRQRTSPGDVSVKRLNLDRRERYDGLVVDPRSLCALSRVPGDEPVSDGGFEQRRQARHAVALPSARRAAAVRPRSRRRRGRMLLSGRLPRAGST